jgi:hypothetical protein
VLAFRAVSLCLAAVLAAVPLVPVEHVHRTEGADGHQRLLAHAHSEAHHVHAVAGGYDTASHLEDDDSVVLTLERVFGPRAVHQLAMTPEPTTHLPAVAAVRTAFPPYFERQIHGPPRVSASPRAPPAIPVV